MISYTPLSDALQRLSHEFVGIYPATAELLCEAANAIADLEYQNTELREKLISDFFQTMLIQSPDNI